MKRDVEINRLKVSLKVYFNTPCGFLLMHILVMQEPELEASCGIFVIIMCIHDMWLLVM